MSVNHYENFPVASWLCPASLRPAVVAIYRYARTADDIADEGDAPAQERLATLAHYRLELRRSAAGTAADPRWAHVFGPLAGAIRRHGLPLAWLERLLDAFEQDVRNPAYADRAALLDYCSSSANPVGRLLLHLYGVADREALAQSDAVCSALQLINFWQDLGIDLRRGRHYVPRDAAARHGLDAARLPPIDTPATRALVAELCGWARGLMDAGAPLVHRIPGRAGWELRLVVQGGLRILDKIERMGHASLTQRPTITPTDLPLMGWRAWRMPRGAAPVESAA